MADKQPEKKEEKKTPSNHAKRLPVEVVRQMLTLATSGFGLVAALAWNNVIQELVNNYVKKYIPGSSGIISLLIYAVIVTILAVIITMQLGHVLKSLESEE